MPPKLRACFDRFGRDRDATVDALRRRRPRRRPRRRGRRRRPRGRRPHACASAGCGRSTTPASTAPIGRITGLIGPNGAGKTTTFNAISGHQPHHPARSRSTARTSSATPPPARGRNGLGRTFQTRGAGRQPDRRSTTSRSAPKSGQAGARVLGQMVARVRRAAGQRRRDRTTPWRCAASPTSPTPRPARCRPVSADWSSWPDAWPGGSICCCSTSPRRGSTTTRPNASARSSSTSSTNAGAASCSSSTTCRW